jgi:hypothetical protein
VAESVCLVTVVSGPVYDRFAREFFATAKEHFRPTDSVRFEILPGVEGWPAATLYRYHVLLSHADRLDCDYLYLVDADMRCEGLIGPEILGSLVAVRHPGYVGRSLGELPYERMPESSAYVACEEGGIYYAGGLVGGERDCFLVLAKRIVKQIGENAERGIIARWHDESHLNRCLIDDPPEITLDPSYLHPDDDSWYLTVWPELYERRLVALDKNPQERGR